MPLQAGSSRPLKSSMLVVDPRRPGAIPRWAIAWVMAMLLAYPALTLVVAGAINTVFFVLFLLSMALLWRPRGRLRPDLPTVDLASTCDPLSRRHAVLYVLSMAGLPVAVLMSQWANQRWGWPYYDAVSRFLLSVPIFFVLRRMAPRQLLILWPGLVLGAAVAVTAVVLDPHNWGSERLGTSFVNPIHFGDIALTLGVLPLFGLGWRAPADSPTVRRVEALLAILAACAGLYASVLSGSRGGWIALPAFVLLFYGMHRATLPRRTILASAGGLLLFLVGAYIWMPEIHQRLSLISSNLHAFDQGNENTSIGIRFQLWKAAWLIFAEHPLFGVGMGGFKALMTPMQHAGLLTPVAADFGRQEVHSEILSRLSQLGLVGLVAILSVYAAPLVLFWQRMNADHPASRAAARMGVVLISGFFIYGLTVETFDLTMTAAFYALTTAVLLAAAYPATGPVAHPIEPPQEHLRCSAF